MKTDDHFVNVLMLISLISDGLVLILYLLTSLAFGPIDGDSLSEGFGYQMIPFISFVLFTAWEIACYFWEKSTASKLAPLICLFCSLLKIGIYAFFFFCLDSMNFTAICLRLSGQATTPADLSDKILVFTLPLTPVIVTFSGLLCSYSLFHLRREHRY